MLKILLIDDDSSFRDLISLILNKLYPGCELMLYEHPDKALEFYLDNARKVDIVITDMVMPGMGGLELANAIKGINPFEKVLLMTGDAMKEVISLEGSDAVDEFLMKDHITLKNKDLLLLEYYIQKTLKAKAMELARRTAEERLQYSEARMRAIVETAVNGIITINEKGIIKTFNKAAEGIFGFSAKEVIGGNIKMLMPEPYRSEHNSYLQRYLTTGERKIIGASRELQGRKRDGTLFPLEASVSETRIHNHIIFTGIIQDITKRKEAEEEFKKLSMAIEHSINIIYITDMNGKFEYVNPMFEKITQYKSEEVLGSTPKILASGYTSNREYAEMWTTILGGRTWEGTFKNKKKNGVFYWGKSIITPIRNGDGELTHFLTVQEDITERKESVEKAQYLTTYDEMTGLFNRTQFVELLGICLSRSGDSERGGAVLLVDVDNFKFINDTYGPSIGDDFLRYIAGLLQNTLQEIDGSRLEQGMLEGVLARLGGDDFALLLPDRNEKDAMEAAELIRKRVEEFSHPALSSDTAETVSVGVVLYPDHGTLAEELLKKVDASRYRAKALGRNRVHLFSSESGDLEDMHSRQKGKELIQKALLSDRFVPWFQPILDLSSNEIHHYEALARMNGEEVQVTCVLAGSSVPRESSTVIAIYTTSLSLQMCSSTVKSQGKVC